jgi:hypothetical protein
MGALYEIKLIFKIMLYFFHNGRIFLNINFFSDRGFCVSGISIDGSL